MADDEEKSPFVKIVLSLLVVVLMIPGLIIEPGPISEIAGLAAIGAIWGFDLPGGDD